MNAHFKGKRFVFKSPMEEFGLPSNKTVFWMRVEGYPKRVNFLNQVGVVFHTEPTSLQDELECEVFNLKDSDIVADDGQGKQIKLGYRVTGKVSPRELIFLRMLNNLQIFKLDDMP